MKIKLYLIVFVYDICVCFFLSFYLGCEVGCKEERIYLRGKVKR